MRSDPVVPRLSLTASGARSPRLVTRDVRVRYGDALALDGVGLEVRDAESVAIMGPSGSGKSTLMHAMAGILSPDEGEVLLRTDDGIVDVSGLSDRERSALRLREFGFVFQQGMLIPELTAVENVMMPLLLAGTPGSAARAAAAQLLSELTLAGMEDRRIGQLSGGQAQRVAIARARATNAQLVFADEPTGALDSRTASDVLGMLLETTTSLGRALVIVTHDEDIASRCSRVVHLHDGRIVREQPCRYGEASR